MKIIDFNTLVLIMSYFFEKKKIFKDKLLPNITNVIKSVIHTNYRTTNASNFI
jgi:hypothetical protein